MIKKGDLVQVIKPTTCCNNPKVIGRVFTVSVYDNHGFQCNHCKQQHKGFPVAMMPDGNWLLMSRLKKIDPPSEGETREAYVNIDAKLKQPRKVTA